LAILAGLVFGLVWLLSGIQARPWIYAFFTGGLVFFE
jgi:uncharacterized membrane protein YedE/YeeE